MLDSDYFLFILYIFYSVLGNEYRLIFLKAWIWLSVFYSVMECEALLLMSYKCFFSINFVWEYQQNFDLKFQTSSVDITTEEGYYVHESFCQNVDVVS